MPAKPLVVKAEHVVIDTVDLVALGVVTGVSFSIDAGVNDVQREGDLWVVRTAGIFTSQFSINAIENRNADLIQFFWARKGQEVPFEYRLTNAPRGATNPEWTGEVLVAAVGLDGATGANKTGTLNLPPTGEVFMSVAA